MDALDAASEVEQLARDLALAYRHPVLPIIGRCHYCRSEIQPGARFCDADCCKDYGALERTQARSISNTRRL